MNTKTNIIAAAAILTTFALPSIALAQQAIFLPPSYTWSQSETVNVPVDAHASALAPTRHRLPHSVRPYGQW
jgi:hypothetical protein